jgi:hypothetical protein
MNGGCEKKCARCVFSLASHARFAYKDCTEAIKPGKRGDSPMNSKSDQMAQIIAKAGINTRDVTVLGAYVHVDTFAKYRAALLHLMSTAGFRLVMERDGVHLGGLDGFRMVFRA